MQENVLGLELESLEECGVPVGPGTELGDHGPHLLEPHVPPHAVLDVQHLLALVHAPADQALQVGTTHNRGLTV